MEPKKKALGKGLEQLFADKAIDFERFESDVVEKEKSNVKNIPIKDIRRNPYQPRKTFKGDALKELADSIKEYGVIQPIIIKDSIKGYELIAGERRLKAAEMAGLKEIPSIIKDISDQEMMDIALLENIQREDLNAIEIAEAIRSIIKNKNITQEEMAEKFGKSRSYVTNMLGLLKLPNEIKQMVGNNKISMSHARSLSKLEDVEEMIKLAHRVIKEDMNVRDLERIISGNTEDDNIPSKPFSAYKIYENLVSEKLNNKVRITKNKMEIKFYDENDLIRILNIMNIKADDD